MPNLYEYWIPKIQDIDEFKKLSVAEQPEIDLFKAKVKQFPKEIIVNTASSVGLNRYERMLDLYKLETTELRRSNILANLNNRLPFTMKYLINLLDIIVGTADYWLNVQGYHIELGVISTKEYLIEMIKQDLRKKIPANIGYSVKSLEPINTYCYTGFYIQTADMITI